MNYVKIIFKCAVAFMFSAVFFFGCGPGKDEVFEKMVAVEKKTKDIIERASKEVFIPGVGYNVKLPLYGPEFKKKYELMKFKIDAAKLAFEKSNYDITLKLLQESEDAADWIIEKHPQWSKACDASAQIRIALSWQDTNFEMRKFDPETYHLGVKNHELGKAAFTKTNFQEAEAYYNRAAAYFKSIRARLENIKTTLASRKKRNNDLKKHVDLFDAKRLASELYQQAAAKTQAAVSAEKEMLFDKSMQLFNESDAIYNRISKEVTPEVVIKDMMASFVKVIPGSFERIVPEGYYSYGKKMVQKIILTKPFFINKYEVTQAQYYAVMKYLPERNEAVADKPVHNISWENAMEFCDKLNKAGYAPVGWKITLPTECQWEFAARGGNKSCGYKFSGSNDLHEVTSVEKLSPVGSKKPNELGLYDMTGNVWELCLDWYGTYLGRSGNSSSDKELVEWMQTVQGYGDLKGRVIRGESWSGNYVESRDRDQYLFSRNRSSTDVYSCCYETGFRLVLVQQD